MTLALAVVALLLALIEELRSKGQNLTAWAVVFLALIFLIGRF